MRLVRICFVATGLLLALGWASTRAVDLAVRTPDLADGKALAEKWCSQGTPLGPS